MAGRRPKPTELKLVTGNRGNRPLNKNEPKPPTDIPRMPAHLPPRAKAVWKRLCKLLSDMGVLTLADALALERLCDIYAEIIELRKDIDENGRTYESIKPLDDIDGPDSMVQKLIKPNPAVGMLADADRRFKGYLTEFGLTPASRSKIQLSNSDGKKKEDSLSKYFG